MVKGTGIHVAKLLGEEKTSFAFVLPVLAEVSHQNFSAFSIRFEVN